MLAVYVKTAKRPPDMLAVYVKTASQGAPGRPAGSWLRVSLESVGPTYGWAWL